MWGHSFCRDMARGPRRARPSSASEHRHGAGLRVERDPGTVFARMPRHGPGAGSAWLFCVSLLMAVHSEAQAQMFFAGHQHPEFTIAPLFIQAGIKPDVRDASIDVLFSVAIPADRSPLEFEGDLFFLWPGEVAAPVRQDPAADVVLARAVEVNGLAVIDEGRLPLLAQRQYEITTDAESIPGGAPYVTFVGTGGPLGLTAPATYVRIPWNPKLVNQAWLIDLRFVAKGLIAPKLGTWVSRTFSGPRYAIALAYNDVSPRAMFSMYFPQRAEVIPVTDPARLVINFAQADALGIDSIAPVSSRRGRSQSLESTEEVSLFLAPIEGLRPQMLTIQFGYFSRLQSWGPIVVPALFFALGNGAGVLARTLSERIRRRWAGRVRVRPRGGRLGREAGRLIPRDALAKIVPGQTTGAQILQLYGPASEEQEGLVGTDRKTVTYRGRREVPYRSWTLGWLTTIGHWDIEDHEVEISLERDVVKDVQLHLRRSRRTGSPGGA
jgi:hypothetical protein